MSSPEEFNAMKSMEKAAETTRQAESLALRDLEDAGIDPNTPAGREFLFRVRAFGINLVNPPKTELNG